MMPRPQTAIPGPAQGRVAYTGLKHDYLCKVDHIGLRGTQQNLKRQLLSRKALTPKSRNHKPLAPEP